MDIEHYGVKNIILSNGKRVCYLIKCNNCQVLHYKAQCEIIKGLSRNKKFFCSRKCHSLYHSKPISVECKNCSKCYTMTPSQISKTKSGNVFCSKSCAATFNNKNKEYGTRRSKLEIFIERNLLKEFPALKVLCNDKSIIGSELDFYFPKIKVAIQINGITHYEPIYGLQKLQQIQKMDEEKRQKCLELNIKLFEINCKDDSYLTESLKRKRLEQVKIILAESNGLDPYTHN
jgi:hypothetical protein